MRLDCTYAYSSTYFLTIFDNAHDSFVGQISATLDESLAGCGLENAVAFASHFTIPWQPLPNPPRDIRSRLASD